MNTVFQKRSEIIDKDHDLKMKIELAKSRLRNLKKQKKQLEDENYNLISIHTTPILFYFGRTKIESSSKEQYTGYFYNYASGQILYRLDDFVSESENVIDIRDFFTDIPLTEENIRKVKENLNTYVEYLRVRYNPESWEELFKLIKKHLYKDEVQRILAKR